MELGFFCLSKGFHISPHLSTSLSSSEGWAWLSHLNQAVYWGAWQVLSSCGLHRYKKSSPIKQTFVPKESYREADYQYYFPFSELPELEPFLSQLRRPISSVRFMKLEPGAEILPRRDHGVCLSQVQARLHLCLTSEPGNDFAVRGEI